MNLKIFARILAVCLAVSSSSLSQAKANEFGFQEFQAGVVDLHGKSIIPTDYDRIESRDGLFQADHSASKKSKKNAAAFSKTFDKDGQESTSIQPPLPAAKIPRGIPAGYTVETPLQTGCIVRADATNGGNLGYIDESGEVRIPFEFRTLRYVNESRIIAGKPDSTGVMRYSLYDTSGHLVATLPDFVQDTLNSAYQDGLLLVGEDIGRAYIALDGTVAIAPNDYRYPSPFYQGLAEIQYKHNGELFCGYVDKHNKLVTELFKDSRADPFHMGLGVITKTLPDGTFKLGAVDKTGRLIFPIEFEPFDTMGPRLVGGRRDGKFQIYLRESGKLYATLPEGCVAAWVSDFEKNEIVPFSIGGVPPSPGMNGNTAFGGKWGFCDEHGKVIIEPQFKSVGTFTGEVAVASIEDEHGDIKTGLIDRKGHWQLPPKYTSIQLTAPDRAIVYNTIGLSAIAHAFHDPKQRDLELFKKVLKYYDLIGMSEAALDSVLGKGDLLSNQETLPTAVCKRIIYDFVPTYIDAKPSLSIEVGIDNQGKIWGWRFREPNGSWDWISDNRIIAKYDKVLTLVNIVPKATHKD